jgi:predicted metal-dependent hydrolase
MEPLWSGSLGEWEERRPPRAAAPLVPPAPAPAEAPELPVEVIRSKNRRKTVSARIVDGRIVIRMPHGMTKAQEAEYVKDLTAKLQRKHTAGKVDLPERARILARRYDLPEPASIRYVSNQASRWGSCTPSTREIRISDRIAGFPDWVVDAVIVHELAHLVHREHSPAFWALVHRYPKVERAYGYLIAKQLDTDDVD